MSEPKYLRPRSLDEAVAWRAAHPEALVLAGGTDALVHGARRAVPAAVLDLWRLRGLGEIEQQGELLSIGAGATWLELGRSELVRTRAPSLVAAAREIGALQIQARGTIGGNIATSSPVGDSLPVLLALDAELELCSVRGTRRLAYRDFCTGYRKTALGPDELIGRVLLPALSPGARCYWRKVGTRRAQSISKVMAAAVIEVADGRIASARVAFGAVADRPVRVGAVEQAVVGLVPAQAAEAARAALVGAISPITDVRSTRDYRVQVAANLAARMFM